MKILFTCHSRSLRDRSSQRREYNSPRITQKSYCFCLSRSRKKVRTHSGSGKWIDPDWFRTEEKESYKNEIREEEIHRDSCKEYEWLLEPCLTMEWTLSWYLMGKTVFSMNPDESTNREPIQCVYRPLPISKKRLRTRGNTDTEFIDLHTGFSCDEKMSELMHEDDEWKYCERKKDSENERHDFYFPIWVLMCVKRWLMRSSSFS